ncbi:MAG: imidazole glycerol phosphate synthase subunit HisF [Actinomycetota bacterium]|nr:imidazole glycerol phosphate synthase subunit HisF [Actinomycetota bacterium]
MLRKRVIPCLDVKDGRVVKGTRFVNLTDEGDPVELARRYAAEGADEICYLDISATPDGRSTMLETIRDTAATVFIPLTVGGGVRSVDDMRRVLRAGADKVVINSAAVQRPRLIQECARAFGRQCVVIAIDARRTGRSWTLHTHGGRVDVHLDAIAWAARAERLGAGELLITSIDRDGTKDGYDLALLRAIRNSTTIPIIASGGAGRPADLTAAIVEGAADAVLAASIFHRSEYSIAEVKADLASAGVAVRGIT